MSRLREQTTLFDTRRATPVRAVRRFCLACTGERPQEVTVCPVTTCALHGLRQGTIPEAIDDPRAAIHGKCLDCAGSPEAVEACEMVRCPLHRYRMGRPMPHARDTSPPEARHDPSAGEDDQLALFSL